MEKKEKKEAAEKKEVFDIPEFEVDLEGVEVGNLLRLAAAQEEEKEKK